MKTAWAGLLVNDHVHRKQARVGVCLAIRIAPSASRSFRNPLSTEPFVACDTVPLRRKILPRSTRNSETLLRSER
jgi:hypothetical protein